MLFRSKMDPDFISKNLNDLCASMQQAIVGILMDKIEKAVKQYGINQIALSGGVSANSGLRNALTAKGIEKGWSVFIPAFEFTTDNAAMIAITGYLKFKEGKFASQDFSPYSQSNY